MKKLLLITAILSALSTGQILAEDPSHWCVCNDNDKKIAESKEVYCTKECGKKGWTKGQAVFQNSSKFKGIVCKCDDLVTEKQVSCPSKCSGIFSSKPGWSGKVVSRQNSPSASITVPESNKEIIDSNGKIIPGV